MNPHQKPQEDVVVTQEDREAAADYAANHIRMIGLPERYRGGKRDDALVQAFARHRLLGHEAGRRDMREAAGKVADEKTKVRQFVFSVLRSGIKAAEAAGENDGPYASSGARDAIRAMWRTYRALPTEPLGGEG